jgi:hypothetical protein
MTTSEARAVLGLTGPTDARTARRAYLRAVKRHKPEQDPDGFQRVRAAYDTVSRALDALDELPALPGHDAPVAAPREAVVPETNRAATPPPDPPRPLSESAPVPEPEHPADLRSWTVEPPIRSVRVERMRDEGPLPEALLILAADHVDVEPSTAVELIEEAMEQATRHPDRLRSPLAAITPILLLHQAGHAAAGRAAWGVLHAWVEDLGLGTRMPHGVAARLLLTREISELPTDFPTDLRSRIASAILANDLVAAKPDLYDFSRVQQLRARDAAAQLAHHAPNLAAVYGSVLATEHRRATRDTPPPSDGRRPLLLWLALVLFVLAVALCGRGVSLDPAAEAPPARTP